MGRYQRLFTLPEDLYTESAPLVIAAGALLKDTVTGEVLAQLKFTCICEKAIKAVKVRITPFDTVGRPLGEAVPFTYLDLFAVRDEEFGQKTPIPLIGSEARSFTVTVEEVAFADNTLWTPLPGAVWEPLPVPQTVEEVLQQDRELVKQYAMKYGQNHTVWPLHAKDFWICGCKALNHAEEERCHRCMWPLEDLDADIEALKTEAAERMERERLAAEKAAEEERLAAEQAAREAAEAAKAAAAAQKGKKVKIAVLAAVVVLAIAAAPFAVRWHKQAAVYAQAEAWLDVQNPTMAALYFKQVEGYKDAQERYVQCLKEAAPARRKVIDSFSGTVSILNTDRTVRITGDSKYENPGEQNSKASGWADITAVTSGYGFTAGLRADGTVVVVGSDGYDEFGSYDHAEGIDVSDWQDITAISAGWDALAGIKSDGTVVVTGDLDTPLKSSEWQDITSLAFGRDIFVSVVGVKKDGTVVTSGFDEKVKKAVSTWTDIISVAVGESDGEDFSDIIIGLKKDGTVVTTDSGKDDLSDVSSWTDIIAIDTCDNYAVGLRSNGTVITTSDRINVENWTDIIAITTSSGTIYGVRADGKVLSAGYDAGLKHNIIQ